MRPTVLTILFAATASAAPPASGQICDLGDRIIVVAAHPHGREVVGPRDAETPLVGSATVIMRASGRRTTAPLEAGSVSADDCGGTGGAHIGCSDTGGWVIRSRALGSDELLLAPYAPDSLVHGDSYRTCRKIEHGPRIAACSTRSWFAEVSRGHDGPSVDLYTGSGNPGSELESPALEEAVPGKRVSVSVTDRGGFVELDGKREPCLATFRATP